jgi:hypothetical protein
MIASGTTTDSEPLVVSPRRARYILDCSNTYLYELLNRKELDSYLEGHSRKITMESIHRLIARRLTITIDTSKASRRKRGRPPKLLRAIQSPAVS